MEYPRCVHRAGNVCRVVRSDADLADALADGWALEPVLTPEQVAAVRAARLAAGEIIDEPPAPEPTPEPRKRGR